MVEKSIDVSLVAYKSSFITETISRSRFLIIKSKNSYAGYFSSFWNSSRVLKCLRKEFVLYRYSTNYRLFLYIPM